LACGAGRVVIGIVVFNVYTGHHMVIVVDYAQEAPE
jgi:hypothetical protein